MHLNNMEKVTPLVRLQIILFLGMTLALQSKTFMSLSLVPVKQGTKISIRNTNRVTMVKTGLTIHCVGCYQFLIMLVASTKFEKCEIDMIQLCEMTTQKIS